MGSQSKVSTLTCKQINRANQFMNTEVCPGLWQFKLTNPHLSRRFVVHLGLFQVTVCLRVGFFIFYNEFLPVLILGQNGNLREQFSAVITPKHDHSFAGKFAYIQYKKTITV